jgi:ArsR family metal-binding transcriptional regulator
MTQTNCFECGELTDIIGMPIVNGEYHCHSCALDKQINTSFTAKEQ